MAPSVGSTQIQWPWLSLAEFVFTQVAQRNAMGSHYGLVKGGQYAGFTTVRYVAVLDDRTSEICKSLDGKEWSIYQAAEIIEAVATSPPEEVKEISPWLRAEEYEGLTDTELADMGVIVPPRHANCRSTLELR